MAKHFENFTMQVAKAHRMEHDKTEAYDEYLRNLLAEKYSRKGGGFRKEFSALKPSLVPVLLPLLVTNGSLTNVATSLVFMKKPARRASRGTSRA